MKKYYKRFLSLLLTCCLMFGVVGISSEALECTDSLDNSTYNVMYVTYDNVKYCQTMARSMFPMINEFRTGSEAWAYDVYNNKEYYDDLSEYKYDYNLEKVAMNRAVEIIANFTHGSSGKNIYWSQSGNESYACGECLTYLDHKAGMNTTEAALGELKESGNPYSEQGHRRALLSSQYTRIGIACVEYNNDVYYVLTFGDERRADLTGNTTTYGTDTGALNATKTVTACVGQMDPKSAASSYASSSFDITEYNVSLAKGNSVDVPEFVGDLVYKGSLTAGSKILDGRCTNITWTSSNSSVAKVENDKIKAVGTGTATLTATVYNTKLTMNVTVTSSGSTSVVATSEASGGNLSSAKVTTISDQTYTGSKIKPSFTVTLGSKTLTKGKDYIYYYSNNINAGTATLTIEGYGDYTGKKTINFKINPKSISSAKVTVSDKTYTGKAITPSFSVKVGSKTLKSGTDYTYSFSNNKNVGTATLKVTGKGNYTGTVTTTFKINPKATSISKLTKAKKAFTVKWSKKTTQTTGYQIRYSTSSKMTSAKTVTVKSYKTTKKKVSKLKSKKKYYVQVRTYKTVNGKNYYSSWSKTKSVKTK